MGKASASNEDEDKIIPEQLGFLEDKRIRA